MIRRTTLHCHIVNAVCALFFVLILCSCATLDIQYYDESLQHSAELDKAHTVVTVQNLPEKSDDTFRLVAFSDIHYRDNAAERYRNAVDIINKSDADLVVFAGDFLSDEEDCAGAFNVLRSITLPCPKIAVRGNWEVNSRHNTLPDNFDFATFFNGAGFCFLQKSWKHIATQNGMVHVYAFDSMYAESQNDDDLVFPRDGITLLIAHEPERFNRADVHMSGTDAAPIYMTCGHTHGGQITFFGKQIFYTQHTGGYQTGRYQSDGAVLYVSSGLGQGRYDVRVCADYDILAVDIPSNRFADTKRPQ